MVTRGALVADAHALQVLRPLLGSHYLPFSEASMRPAALVVIANDVVLHERRCVVECGSGLSTLVLARVLAEQGGHLVTLEHDPAWANVVGRLLRREGLEDVVTLVEAPLRPAPAGALDWYDVDAMAGAMSERGCDLLVVDGPPAHEEGKGLARLPAVPVLRRWFAPSCTVVLDDADREGERAVVQEWERQTGVSFALRGNEGVAVGHFGEAPFSI